MNVWNDVPKAEYDARRPFMHRKRYEFEHLLFTELSADQLQDAHETMHVLATEIGNYLQDVKNGNRLKLFLPQTTVEMLPEGIRQALKPHAIEFGGMYHETGTTLSPPPQELLTYLHRHEITDYTIIMERESLIDTQDTGHYRSKMMDALNIIAHFPGAVRLIDEEPFLPESIGIEGFVFNAGLDAEPGHAPSPPRPTPTPRETAPAAIDWRKGASQINTNRLIYALNNIVDTMFSPIHEGVQRAEGSGSWEIAENTITLNLPLNMTINGIPAFTSEGGELQPCAHVEQMLRFVNTILAPAGTEPVLDVSLSEDQNSIVLSFDRSLADMPEVTEAAFWMQSSGWCVRQAAYAAYRYARHMLPDDDIDLRYSLIPPEDIAALDNPRAYRVAVYCDTGGEHHTSDEHRHILENIQGTAATFADKAGKDSPLMKIVTGKRQGTDSPDYALLLNVSDLIDPHYERQTYDDGNVQIHFAEKFGLYPEENFWTGNLLQHLHEVIASQRAGNFPSQQ